MMRSRFTLAAGLAGLMFAAACQEDPEAAANTLFVEAATALTQATSIIGATQEERTERQKLLTLAAGNLEKIVSTYPSSSLAVDLASSGSAKGISVATVKKDLACAEKPGDGQCAVDALLKREMAREIIAERRATVIQALAANARWDDVFALIESLPEGQDREMGLSAASAFVILLADAGNRPRFIALTPEWQRQDTEEMLESIRERLQNLGWEIKNRLAPNFLVTGPVLTDAVTVEAVSAKIKTSVDGLVEQVEAGNLDQARSVVTEAVLTAEANAERLGSEERELVYTGLYQALDQSMWALLL